MASGTPEDNKWNLDDDDEELYLPSPDEDKEKKEDGLELPEDDDALLTLSDDDLVLDLGDEPLLVTPPVSSDESAAPIPSTSAAASASTPPTDPVLPTSTPPATPLSVPPAVPSSTPSPSGLGGSSSTPEKKITVSSYKPAPAAPTVESSRAKFKLAHMRGGFWASALANLVGGGDGVGRALGVKPLETKSPGEKAGETSEKKSAAAPEAAKTAEKLTGEAPKEPIAPMKKEEPGHGEDKQESKKH